MEIDIDRIILKTTQLGELGWQDMLSKSSDLMMVDGNLDLLEKRDEVFVQLKGEKREVLYIYKLCLLNGSKTVAIYEYIVDEYYHFIDEFFILY